MVPFHSCFPVMAAGRQVSNEIVATSAPTGQPKILPPQRMGRARQTARGAEEKGRRRTGIRSGPGAGEQLHGRGSEAAIGLGLDDMGTSPVAFMADVSNRGFRSDL